MRLANVLIMTCSLAVTSLALAEGGGDRTFDRMVKDREVAMEVHKAAVDRDVVQQKIKVEQPQG